VVTKFNRERKRKNRGQVALAARFNRARDRPRNRPKTLKSTPFGASWAGAGSPGSLRRGAESSFHRASSAETMRNFKDCSLGCSSQLASGRPTGQRWAERPTEVAGPERLLRHPGPQKPPRNGSPASVIRQGSRKNQLQGDVRWRESPQELPVRFAWRSLPPARESHATIEAAGPAAYHTSSDLTMETPGCVGP
jgi:hypothetical protein